MGKTGNTPQLIEIGGREISIKALEQARRIFSAAATVASKKTFTSLDYHFSIENVEGCPCDVRVSRENGTDKVVVNINDGEAIIKGAVSQIGPIVTDVIIPEDSYSRGECLLSIPPVVAEQLKQGDDIVEEIAQKLREELKLYTETS